MFDLNIAANGPGFEQGQVRDRDQQNRDRLMLRESRRLAAGGHHVEIVLERSIGDAIAHEVRQRLQKVRALRSVHRDERGGSVTRKARRCSSDARWPLGTTRASSACPSVRIRRLTGVLIHTAVDQMVMDDDGVARIAAQDALTFVVTLPNAEEPRANRARIRPASTPMPLVLSSSKMSANIKNHPNSIRSHLRLAITSPPSTDAAPPCSCSARRCACDGSGIG